MKMEENFLDFDCDSESDENCDLYGDDPVFETKEDLDAFLGSCHLEKVKPCDKEVNVCYEHSGMEKNCTCGFCEDIWSGQFQHICCKQKKK